VASCGKPACGLRSCSSSEPICGKNYAAELNPDPALVNELGLDQAEIIVTVRPPATEAHYHNHESETLFVEFMNRLCTTPKTKAVLLPRNKRQEAQIRSSHGNWFENSQVVIPMKAVDGLNLLWHSDLVVSGGGTMNREAAALGIPVYSIFRGKIGAVDRQLQKEGRLTLIDDPTAQQVLGYGYLAGGYVEAQVPASDDCTGNAWVAPVTISWLPDIRGFPAAGGSIEGTRTKPTCIGIDGPGGSEVTTYNFSLPPKE
jgi:hypothetical protein